ncbi:SDR family oxidoreductase [Ktedonosporobacter rubrisoli]|uniref:SDR family oxidoreductase n=1 Tax=Ktedonosporobacter rubrisoli TaxID=2509675 RepID=A0A4P6JLT5_KTERU|nr:SDR family oxidoreductase [Ktedonosporobacter rubrisoli]QBD76199.1 SDR family oxidoreductase [Ktedonosporobacter rubrisoli]
MKLLILGGTVFLGRYLVEAALGQGHEVTIFHRGVHETPFSTTKVEHVQGDRNEGLTALAGRRFDAVIDTNGYVPRHVKAVAQTLAENIKRYVFISSISVYADFSTAGLKESSPLGQISPEQAREAEQLRPPTTGTIALTYGEMYGPLKALCEQTAEELMPGRVLAIRPGLIVGPHDYSDRFNYWVQRVARGGEVLAPGRPDRPIQLIDVRDLAEWTIRMIEAGHAGVYNATGLDAPLTMQQFLETCKSVSGATATFTWVDEAFLLEKGVVPWSQLPLWLPESDESLRGFLDADIQKALAAGLTFRPLAQTVGATLAWEQQRSPDEQRKAGMSIAQESELLQAWHQR